jgi:hypothetical protein
MINILKNKVAEYILCVIAVLSLSLNLFQSFNIPDRLALNMSLTIGLISAAILALYFAFFSFKSSIISTCILMVLIVGFAIYSNVTDFFIRHSISFKEEYIYYFIILICCIVVFITSKSKAGIIILFLSGITAFFFLSVLQYTRFFIWFIAFLASVGVMFLIKIYTANTVKFKTEKSACIGYCGVALASCGLSLIISGVIFCGITGLFHPQAKPLALLTNNTVLKMATKVGAASPITVSKAETYYKKEYKKTTTTNDTGKLLKNRSGTSSASSSPSLKQAAPNSPKQAKLNRITYFSNTPLGLIVAICILSAIILAYVIKFICRFRMIKKIARIEKNEQILMLYAFYMKMLKKIGYRRNPIETPLEFTSKLCKSVNTIQFSQVTFEEITSLVNKVYYGNQQINNYEYARLQEFNNTFLKSCRKNTGTAKYVFMYLAL